MTVKVKKLKMDILKSTGKHLEIFVASNCKICIFDTSINPIWTVVYDL